MHGTCETLRTLSEAHVLSGSLSVSLSLRACVPVLAPSLQAQNKSL